MGIPFTFLLDPRVQATELTVMMAAVLWLLRRSVKHGEILAELKAVVTNHYSHRFERIKERLGLTWEDEQEDDD